jgi:dolichol-phosphate mannosyltransferase
MLAAIIPCYRVTRHIVGVVEAALAEVDRIYVVDDCCPEGSGDLVAARFPADRVRVLRHAENQGVGGAVLTGYRAAADDGFTILVKLDGDGQMDARRIPELIAPILAGTADYSKGNRFFAREYLEGMPPVRLIGNSLLSFVNKASSGYWNVMDPTNGFTAIHAGCLRQLPLHRIAKRYFFESDMLFRLGTLRAVVKDVPIEAIYGDEVSNLRIRKVLDWPLRYLGSFAKRFVYSYLLRDMNVGTIETLAGLGLLVFGLLYGLSAWAAALATGQLTPSGTVMLSSIGVILGVQFLLAAVSFDVANVPVEPIHRRPAPPPALPREPN